MPLEEDNDDEVELEWLLGFVDPPEHPTDLLRHRFPSKVGGRPAWLNPLDLPTRSQLTCSASGRVLNFLMQVYAPPPDQEIENVNAFHRTVFLFVSPEGDKLTQPGAVRALRCQLPRANPFYSFDPPSSSDDDKFPPTPLKDGRGPEPGRDPWSVAEAEAALASTSGRGSGSGATKGKKGKAGKESQAAASTATASLEDGLTLFPEMELVVEAESDIEEDGAEDPQVQRLLKQYEAQVAEEGELTEEELPKEILDQVEDNVSKDRQHYVTFQTRVASAPEQCLRYCFREGAIPICPSPEGIPESSSIPPCPRCGGPRVFEFQVMPQLLNYLNLDETDSAALDWGTIAVYSCKASCPIDVGGPVEPAASECAPANSAYTEEFVWVQAST